MRTTGHVPVLADPPVLADLPVQVQVSGALRAELVSWLEGDLRWQVVSGNGALAATLLITDDPLRAAGALLVVDGGAPPEQRAGALARALRSGALETVEWPAERDLIVALAQRLTADGVRPHPADDPARTRVLRVAGICGGAGTSTIALALGAWAAWAGARSLVIGACDMLELCGHAPWKGPGIDQVITLAPADIGREVATLSRSVPGVPNLNVIAGGAPTGTGISALPADVVIIDARCDLDAADVIVAVADRRLRSSRLHRGRMLVRTGGAVGRREIVRLLGGTPSGWIAEDPRVLRAGLAARVPAGLPGRWLRNVASAVSGCARVAA